MTTSYGNARLYQTSPELKPTSSGSKDTRSENSIADGSTISFTDVSSSMLHVFSETSTMTRTDIPGAGRILGKAIARSGRQVERYLGQIASSFGFGPQAVTQNIIARLTQARMNYFSMKFPGTTIESEVYLGCEKLLQFVRGDIPLNQQSSIKCIMVLLSAFPVLHNFFDSHHATLAFDMARRLPALRSGNASIPGHLKTLKTLMKCLALFTRDNVVNDIIERHRAENMNSEYSERSIALSLIAHLLPYFKHPFLYLPAIQHSGIVLMQILLRDTHWNVLPKDIIGTIYTMNFDAIGPLSSSALTAVPRRNSTAIYVIRDTEDGHHKAWEELCNTIIEQKTVDRPYTDIPGVDRFFDMLLFSLREDLSLDWTLHRFSVDVTLLLHRKDKVVYPRTHKTAHSMVITLDAMIRPLDELTRTIADYCQKHRHSLIHLFYESKDGEQKGQMAHQALYKWCQKIHSSLQSEAMVIMEEALNSIIFLVTQFPFIRCFLVEPLDREKRLLMEAQDLFSESSAVMSATRRTNTDLMALQSASLGVLYDLLCRRYKTEYASLAARGFAISALSRETDLAASERRTPCAPPHCRCYSATNDDGGRGDFSWLGVCDVSLRLIALWEPELPCTPLHWRSALDEVITQVLVQISFTCAYRRTILKGEIPPDQLIQLMQAVMSLRDETSLPRAKREVQQMTTEIMAVEPTYDVLTWMHI